jgi:hypothetical protein
VVEASGAGWRSGATLALPGVEADVVVIAACGEEGRRIAHPLREFEAENVAVEGECAVEVGDLEVDVTDAGLRVDGAHVR